MNKRANHNHYMAVGIAAASAALAAFGMASPAVRAQSSGQYATQASSATVTILTPTVGAVFSGDKQIEVSAHYVGTDNSGAVSKVEFIIDGQTAASKVLDQPSSDGLISFLIDPTTLDVGRHKILIRTYTTGGDTASVHTTVDFKGLDAKPTVTTTSDAKLTTGISILTPKASEKVTGTVTVNVRAVDASGTSPYVSLFVDKVFKTLRNYPPYSFQWDTTTVANGWHTIEASAYTDDSTVGKTDTLRVYVNNFGGDTIIDKALTDTAPSAKHNISQPVIAPSAVKAALLAHPKFRSSYRANVASQKLASADLKEQSVSEQTLLSAPFIRHRASHSVSSLSADSAQMVNLMAAIPTTIPNASKKLSGVPISDLAPSNGISLVRPSASEEELPISSPKLSNSSASSIKGAASSASLMEIAASTVSSGLAEGGIDLNSASQAPAVDKAIQPAALASRLNDVITVVPTEKKLLGVQVASAALETVSAEAPRTILKAENLAKDNLDVDETSVSGSPALASNVEAFQMPVTSTRSVKLAGIPLSDIASDNLVTTAPQAKLKSFSKSKARSRVNVTVIFGKRTAKAKFPSQVLELIAGQKQVVLNNEMISLDRPIETRSNEICTPIRQIIEGEGGTLEWSSKTQSVRALTPTRDIRLRIGSTAIFVNNVATQLSLAPYINAGRTMIPLGFLPVALDVHVAYDPVTGRLDITSNH